MARSRGPGTGPGRALGVGAGAHADAFEELWDAYPLDPEQAPPTAAPIRGRGRSPRTLRRSRRPRRAARRRTTGAVASRSRCRSRSPLCSPSRPVWALAAGAANAPLLRFDRSRFQSRGPRRAASRRAVTRRPRVPLRRRRPCPASRRRSRPGSRSRPRGRRLVHVSPTRAALITRRAALEASAVALGGAVVAGVVLGDHADPALSRPSAKQDAEILNFALLLEYVQAAFYAEALQRAGLTGELKTFAQTVGAHEQDHIALLKQALGSAARRPLRSSTSATTPPTPSASAWPRSSSRTSASPPTTRRHRTSREPR